MSFLDKIFAAKIEEVKHNQTLVSLEELKTKAHNRKPTLDFYTAIKRCGTDSIRLIAEVKKASPSKGLLAPNFNPLALAQAYQKNGAAAISVLTDEDFFQGSLTYLSQIAALNLNIPLLRKDFIYHPYQLYEARVYGADAVLLIAAYLSQQQLQDLKGLSESLGMAALIEVHNQQELEKVLSVSPVFIGINNRDLHTFQVTLETSLSLKEHIPSHISVIAESGIFTRQDVEVLQNAGIDAMLVGEALVKADDPGNKVRSLLS